MKNMKKYIIPALISFLFIGCTRDDVNSDPNAAYTTLPTTLLTYSQKELSDYVNTCSVNENNFRLTMQYWQETTYINESIYDFTNRNVSNTIFIDNYINVLNNLTKAKSIINAYVPAATEVNTWPAIKKNQLAIIDILQVYTYQNLVDTFGNVPYSQSNQLETIPTPVYDDASSIYTNLISRLDTDIQNLDPTKLSFQPSDDPTGLRPNADIYYNGVVSKWKIFGSSILLKLGMGLADANPTLAQSTVTKALGYGVMSSSADNCILQYLGSSPNWSPVYENVKASNRNDFVGGKTLVDYMNTNTDKRIAKYFKPVAATGTYIGQTIGSPATFANFSAPGTFAYTTTTPGILLNYTEVAFYLTEASARWGIGGTPAVNYANAITSSFTDWGVAADAAAYIAAHPYNATNWKKSVGEQAWVAMYNQPLTSWNFWRRLDYPALTAPPAASPITSVPVRMMYPINESTTNGANWAAAGAAIGGDKLTTKLFWDKF